MPRLPSSQVQPWQEPEPAVGLQKKPHPRGMLPSQELSWPAQGWAHQAAGGMGSQGVLGAGWPAPCHSPACFALRRKSPAPKGLEGPKNAASSGDAGSSLRAQGWGGGGGNQQGKISWNKRCSSLCNPGALLHHQPATLGTVPGKICSQGRPCPRPAEPGGPPEVVPALQQLHGVKSQHSPGRRHGREQATAQATEGKGK